MAAKNTFMYKALYSPIADAKIVKVKVDRQTDKSIWIGGERRLKKSIDAQFFESFDEAKKNLVASVKQRMEVDRERAKISREKLKEIRALKG